MNVGATVILAADPPADWWARGLAIAALAMSILGLLLGRRDARWKRKANKTTEVARPLRELYKGLSTADEPHLLSMNLWATRYAIAAEQLEDGCESLADLRLRWLVRKALKDFHAGRGRQANLSEAREGVASVNKPVDVAALERARITIGKAIKRLERISRHAPG